MSVSDRKRRLVFLRDGDRCMAEGVAAADRLGHSGLTVQHRLNRGMGGSNLLDGFENLVTLCWLCNTRLEQDAEWAEVGRLFGWKLRSGENPTYTAVWAAWAAEWRLLGTDGGWRVVEGLDGHTAGRDRFAEWRES